MAQVMNKVGVDLPSDIVLAAPGRTVDAVRSGASLTRPAPRARRPLRTGGHAGRGAAAGGRFFSRSDIDMVSADVGLSATWLAATSGGGFSASAYDISAESERALEPPKFQPRESLAQLRTASRVARRSPHAAPERKPRVASRPQPQPRPRRKKEPQQQGSPVAGVASRPYALQSPAERPKLANVSPQRRPTSAAHRPTSAVPRPRLKGRVPWMSLIGVEGDRPAMYERTPSKSPGPTLTHAKGGGKGGAVAFRPASGRKPQKNARGSSARRRGRPSTAMGSADDRRSRSPPGDRPRSAEALDPARSLAVLRPSTAPGARFSDPQPEEVLTRSVSPTADSGERTRSHADLSYSRALAATGDAPAGDTISHAGGVGAEYVSSPTALKLTPV